MSRAIEVGEPNWEPLKGVLWSDDCCCFMYMGTTSGIVLYKHRYTRRYLNIEAETGRFYRYADGDYIEINRVQAIEHVYGSRQI